MSLAGNSGASYFYLGVVHMRHYLAKVAHVDQRTADRAIAEMIDLGFCDAVSVDAGIAWDHKGATP
jgi:hypothetical protein